jgi:hypothetical protein
MDLIGYLVLLKVQMNKKDADYKAVYDKFDGVDQLGLPLMRSNGTDKDIDKVRYTNGTMTGY